MRSSAVFTALLALLVHRLEDGIVGNVSSIARNDYVSALCVDGRDRQVVLCKRFLGPPSK